MTLIRQNRNKSLNITSEDKYILLQEDNDMLVLVKYIKDTVSVLAGLEQSLDPKTNIDQNTLITLDFS